MLFSAGTNYYPEISQMRPILASIHPELLAA
jgi:hypothetical protein